MLLLLLLLNGESDQGDVESEWLSDPGCNWISEDGEGVRSLCWSAFCLVVSLESCGVSSYRYKVSQIMTAHRLHAMIKPDLGIFMKIVFRYFRFACDVASGQIA